MFYHIIETVYIFSTLAVQVFAYREIKEIRREQEDIIKGERNNTEYRIGVWRLCSLVAMAMLVGNMGVLIEFDSVKATVVTSLFGAIAVGGWKHFWFPFVYILKYQLDGTLMYMNESYLGASAQKHLNIGTPETGAILLDVGLYSLSFRGFDNLLYVSGTWVRRSQKVGRRGTPKLYVFDSSTDAVKVYALVEDLRKNGRKDCPAIADASKHRKKDESQRDFVKRQWKEGVLDRWLVNAEYNGKQWGVRIDVMTTAIEYYPHKEELGDITLYILKKMQDHGVTPVNVEVWS
jgi:hypothetical protein